MTTSISKLGRYEPFELQVAEGAVGYHSVVHVFGFNPDVDSAAEEAVWPVGGLIPYLASPVAMTVSSSSADDTSAGTGARTVLVRGINAGGEEVTETVTLNGQTAVNTANTYSFIQQVIVMTAGSGKANAGVIYVGTGTVTAGVPAVAYNAISIGDNNSLTGAWTCPTGYTGYITFGSIATGTENGANYLTGRLKVLGTDGLERTAAIVTFANGDYIYDFKYPVKITAGQRVTATVKSTADNEACSSYFQIVVVEDTP